MSRKSLLDPSLKSSIIVPDPVGPSGSLATSFVTKSTKVLLGDTGTYQMNWLTTNSQGNFYLQACDDDVDAHFVDVGLCGVVNAANDTSLLVVEPAGNFFYRLRYASSVAGTGTVQILTGWKAKGG